MIKGEEAATAILSAPRMDYRDEVVSNALKLKEGEEVMVWPIDSGMNDRDQGILCALTSNEVVIDVKTLLEGRSVRVHYPRHNFRVVLARSSAKI